MKKTGSINIKNLILLAIIFANIVVGIISFGQSISAGTLKKDLWLNIGASFLAAPIFLLWKIKSALLGTSIISLIIFFIVGVGILMTMEYPPSAIVFAIITVCYIFYLIKGLKIVDAGETASQLNENVEEQPEN